MYIYHTADYNCLSDMVGTESLWFEWKLTRKEHEYK